VTETALPYVSLNAGQNRSTKTTAPRLRSV